MQFFIDKRFLDCAFLLDYWNGVIFITMVWLEHSFKFGKFDNSNVWILFLLLNIVFLYSSQMLFL